MIEDNLKGYASTQIDKTLSYSEAIRKAYIQAKEFEGELWIKATHYHIQKQERKPLTDKQIDEIYYNSDLNIDDQYNQLYAFVKAIEFTHGIKE
jgi:hypothetical protein